MATFTNQVSEILAYGKEEALRLNTPFVGPEHIMLGIIRQNGQDVADVFRQLNIDPQKRKKELEDELASDVDPNIDSSAHTDLSLAANNILKLAVLEARLQHTTTADVKHVLLGILHDKTCNKARMVLEQNKIDYNMVVDVLEGRHINPNANMPAKSKIKEEEFDDDDEMEFASGGSNKAFGTMRGTTAKKESKTPMIDNFGIDLTKAAEGLVAGTKYRGQFEERIKVLVRELEKNPDIIIFIDEIHTLVGAGSAPGTMDAANILKPSLARGLIQCIGATTLDEYRKSIEKDGALERRFQKIIVEPTSSDETLQILKNIRQRYEQHHSVKYSDNALKACVELTERYINDRQFPDKAIDALDESGAHIHMSKFTLSPEIIDLQKHIAEIKEKKQEAIKNQDFRMAADLRNMELSEEERLLSMQESAKNMLDTEKHEVEDTDVADIVSRISGVPVQKMCESENQRLKNMGPMLKSQVVAQDNAIDKMVKAIQRNRIGLRDPNHPIGVFMFLGPTGVGKTYLAKKLAEYMFGTKDALIRIDMSEYGESFNVSRLVGAPPGYVGYEEGGQLTEKVRRRPYSIVLLDEIEKAHTNVFNMLLQVLDEGRLTDGSGRLIDFRNTVIIMTSNAGTRQLKEFQHGVGFNAAGMVNGMATNEKDKEYARNIIQKALSKQFSPEFLNRLDEIITFDQLDINAIRSIVDIEIKPLLDRIEKLGYDIEITSEAKDFVARKGYDIQFGARPLKRALQNHIEDGICEMIINETLTRGDKILIDKDKENDKLMIIRS